MEVNVSATELSHSLTHLLHGHAESSNRRFDLTAEKGLLTVLTTGSSIGLPAEIRVSGTAKVPAPVVFRMSSMLSTIKTGPVTLRFTSGKLFLNKTSIANKAIVTGKVSKREIDIPEDATPMDLLALGRLYSRTQLAASDLAKPVNQADQDLKKNLQTAAVALEAYGITFAAIDAEIQTRVSAHVPLLLRALKSS